MFVYGKFLDMVVYGGMDCSEEPGVNKTTVAVERSSGPVPIPGFIGAGSAGAYEVFPHDPTGCKYGDDLFVDNRSKAWGAKILKIFGTSKIEPPLKKVNPMVNVKPLRGEDLQPSYAQNLAGESDQGAHGWYGSMSKSAPSQSLKQTLSKKDPWFEKLMELLQVKEVQPWYIHNWELPKKDPLFEKLMEKPPKRKNIYVWHRLFMWDINFVLYWIRGGGKSSMTLKFKGLKREAGVLDVVECVMRSIGGLGWFC